MANETKFISPAELVERWRGSIKIGTLANWRSRGYGPRFQKIGLKVVYRLDEIEKWENENQKLGADLDG